MELTSLLNFLGLDATNGLYITKDNLWKKETAFPNRVKLLIEKRIQPDAFFCFDNKPLVLFFENHSNPVELHRMIWNFNECPIVIMIQKDVVEIFNGFNFLKERNKLEKLGDSSTLNLFTYFELVTGSTWSQFPDKFHYKNRIDYHLLNNIRTTRDLLIDLYKLNPKIANALIGKCIFVRYLIDRKVKMKFDGKLRAWTNNEFCELLNDPNKILQFFQYLEDNEKGFNGDIFPLESKEYEQVKKEHYWVLYNLLQGEALYKNQLSMFQLYDFSIIPIEFISNVYELFIGEDNQKNEGAYYTPLFLVDYILKETVDKKITKSHSHECRVLDPACGSGIFLVETLRKIIEEFIVQTEIDVKSERFKTALRNLAKDNIYGIDKDLSAIQVAIFSIYLTLLDYLDPPGIETFKFPKLLGTNFFNSDFFDEESCFNEELKDVSFDFIVGNPPWKGSSMKELGNSYLKRRKANEKKLGKKYEIAINNNEIAEGFVLRVSDFCIEYTQIALIIRSSTLYNLGYNDEFSPFRQYWLEEFFIDRVFELAPVRYEVFEKSNQPAVAPAAVVFYRYANGKETNGNLLEHITLKQSSFFSLFKIFTITRPDYKKVKQVKLKEFDWLWKVLVYGSYLDFNFVKRLKDQYLPIKDIISDETKFIEGTGIQFSSTPTYTSTHLKGLPFIDSYGVQSFFIDPKKINVFDRLKVHRLRDERLFKAPMLLVREGIDMSSLTARCAIAKDDFLFKDSITSIKVLAKSDLKVLGNIAAIFASPLFSYYAVNTFSSIGIERERVKNYNKYSLPYLDLGVTKNIQAIENAYEAIYFEEQKILNDSFVIQQKKDKIKKELSEIEHSIFKKIDLNDIERSLIDYALHINGVSIVGSELEKRRIFSPLPFSDNILKDYAALFLNRFKNKIDDSKNRFTIEVWQANQIIGMFFKTVPVSKFEKDVVWKEMQSDDMKLMSILIKIGSEKITDKLFIQKDIRGFEKDYFYIIKPNERKLWHKAIAYLDIDEFADAILRAGRAGD